jgi:hypothetical protein
MPAGVGFQPKLDIEAKFGDDGTYVSWIWTSFLDSGAARVSVDASRVVRGDGGSAGQ